MGKDTGQKPIGDAYDAGDEIVIVGRPENIDLPEDHPGHHNCDAMGCSTVSHVLYRFPISPARLSPQPTEGHGANVAIEDGNSGASFQSLVQPWLLECFGQTTANDVKERNHRFLEEALELVQACGCTQNEAYQLVDYVYGRPVGEKGQEVGGAMITLAALCLAQGLDMHACGDTELARIWTQIDQIRAKQAAKPKHSPLPQHVLHITCMPGSDLGQSA